MLTKKELRERIEERSKAIYEMIFIDSMNECIEDMRLDLECMSKAKTFKQICELQDRDYREEIRMLKESDNER
jgi:hypothetical protein